ncbi:right-handed parallel beta-helix repeat-containing protein [Hymenobacter gummosus]|uniref:right-handed parallel beta-helix repeat-containing protein n=1 Tax=Hymenobacter gummosus TaxID=1776032 RepID=UPI001A9F0A0E|nr:right-handed parallel beta-helix repeat-containing protein [Hymenobacter gummosus]
MTDITSTTVVPLNSGGTGLTPGLSGTDSDGNLSGFRLSTLPPASQGTLYIANSSISAYEVAQINVNYSAARAQYLAFASTANATVGATSFTFRAYDATNGFSNTATYTFQVGGPSSVDVLSDMVSNGAGPVVLTPYLQGYSAGTVTGYVIKSIPNTSTQGTLALNGTPVTVNQVISPNDLPNLTFDPVATAFGAVEFTYVAQDNTGTEVAANTYSIPVAKSGCADANTANFRARTTGEDWKTSRTLTVEGLNITSTYSSSVAAGETTFSIAESFNNKVLTLTTDYTTNAATTNNAVATFALSRAVTGFSFAINDIDKLVGASNGSGWEDIVRIDGRRPDNTIYTLTAADIDLGTNNVNTFSGNNTITGTANSGGLLSNVVITFPVAINQVVVTYRNGQTSQPNPGSQIISFTSFAWCATADVTTALTAPATLLAGVPSGNYSVSYTNNGPDAANDVTRTVSVQANVASAVSAPGGTVTGSQAGGWTITYPAATDLPSGTAVSYNFTLTPLPVSSITVTSNTTTSTGQGTDTAPNTASTTTTVTPVADVYAQFTAPAAATTTATAGTTVNYTVQFGNNGPSPAAGVTRVVSIPAGVPSVTQTGGTLSGNQTSGWTITYTGGTIASGNADSYSFSIVAPASGSPVLTATTTTTTNQNGVTSNDSQTRTLDVTPVVLSGNIFDDVNYGGGAGRDYAAANTAAQASGFASGAILRANARVELYDASGIFVAATTSAANGSYSFNVPSAANYTVRVVNSTVTSVRALNSGFTAANTTAVQTFVYNDVNRVGGETPSRIDAAANTTNANLATLTAGSGQTATTAQSIKLVTVPAAGLTGVDFGFNFDVITNTNDAGQGSLRQFINNSNALSNTNLAQNGQTAGREVSIFMIPNGAATGAPAGLRNGLTSGLTNGVASISPASVLPDLEDANTSIDGTLQTTNIQNSNTGTLGSGGNVGTAGTALATVNQPEVQILGSTARAIGLDVSSTATGTLIRGLAIAGFGNATNNNANANIRVTASNVTITGNVIGGTADNFSTAQVSNADNIRITGGTGIQITNNLIGFANGYGVRVNTSTSATISGNEISGNGRSNNLDGINVVGGNVAISNNLITGHNGNGIELAVDGDGAAVSGNTISGNGVGTGATSGIRIAADNATISSNVITGNYGAGIRSLNGADNNTFSQNSIYSNGNVANNAGSTVSGQIGIDLLSSAQTSGGNQNNGVAPYVTLNDNGDGDSGANGLTNMPIIQTATVRNGVLYVAGFTKPGATVEFFVAEPNPASSNATGANFGQGRTFLFSRVEGVNGSDLDGSTGSYSGNINGFAQGTETNQNRFTFAVALSSLTAAQQTALSTAGVLITSTATLSAVGTSEFSGNAPVLQAPVATNDFTTTAPNTPVTLTVTTNDQNNIDPATVNLNGQGAGSTTAVAVTGGTFQFTSAGQVLFTPTTGFTGIATVPYTVNNTSGVSSNTAFISVEVKAPNIDLATSFTSPANNSTAGASQTYSVRAANNSSVAVNDVVQTLQLPAGLTTGGGTVSVTGGAYTSNTTLYNNTTGVLSIPVGTMAANTNVTYNVAVSNMPGSGPVTATATIGGTGTETNTTNNVVTLTLNVSPRYDVATTISGPATAVVRGNEVTYTVTTSNLSSTSGSVSPAPNVIQVVQLPTGLTGVFASNGGTYNSGNGRVTFPAIGSLPVGQTVVNSISFAAPSANFGIPTAVVTAGASSDNAGDLATGNNSANLNGLATGTQVGTVAGTAAVNVYTTVTPSASTVAPGAPVTLTVTASNAGPNTANAVTETLLLPTGLTGVSVSNGGSYDINTGLVTFTSFGNLASAGSASATVTFNAPAQGVVLATATVATTSADILPADNLAQVKVEVSSVADLATTLAGPTTVSTGQLVTYTVTTSNSGEAPATGVVQRVSLPAGLSGVQVSNGGSYDINTGIVTFNISNLMVKGASQVNTITYEVPVGARSFTASASVSSNTPETTLTNNTAAVATTVQAVGDIVVALSGPTSAPVGSAVTFSVSTRNAGPAAATNVVPTLQLPAGLGANAVTVTGGGSYDNTTGLVTFGTTSFLASGSSLTSTATLTMPDVASLNAVARATAGSVESNYDNNVATTSISGSTAPTSTVDLRTSIVSSLPNVNPNSSLIIAANYTNNGPVTANNVVVSLALPAGLQAFGTVTVSGGTGGSYNIATGLVTWNPIASLASGASLPTNAYSVSFTAPNSGTVQATSFVRSDNGDSNPANNSAPLEVPIDVRADVATSVSGPATTQPGATVTYAVMTLNNGPTPASSTQTVTIPAGATNITYSGASGPVSVANGTTTITFPAISNQTVGASGEVTNYVTFSAPSTNYTVTANVTPTNSFGEVSGNNSASTPTTINRAPVAYNVVNNLQTPQATTAGPLLISPLLATDADASTTLTYTITSLPASAAGTLYLGPGTGSPITNGQTLTAAQINTLRFDPANGFIGNAFFTYTATDNASAPATSNTAIYTIAVGQDVNSVYTAAPTRGGLLADAYRNNDLIASVLDANAARYNSSGQMYTVGGTNNGTLVGSDNGVRSATTDAAGTTLLNTLGLTLNATNGEIRVTNVNNLNLRAGSYTLNVTTVDANGGTNTQVVAFTIGFGPLPVELVDFAAKAQNTAALLTWRTAQEKNNSHFEVERSIDGVNFVKVGRVAGHGTSTTAHQYSFTDAEAARQASTVYYRLQQVDLDGTTTTTDTRAVRFDKQAGLELALYPNPAVETLNVRLLGATDASSVLIYNTAGSLVLKGQLAGSLATSLDVRALPAGTYLVKVQGANGLNLTRRFVKN